MNQIGSFRLAFKGYSYINRRSDSPMKNQIGNTPQPVAISRRGVPFWAQIIVWGLLVGLLILIGMGLRRTQQGTIQPGDPIPDFSLTLFSGYEYDGQSSVEISDLRDK